MTIQTRKRLDDSDCKMDDKSERISRFVFNRSFLLYLYVCLYVYCLLLYLYYACDTHLVCVGTSSNCGIISKDKEEDSKQTNKQSRKEL